MLFPMPALAEIYWVQFKTQLAVQFQYRAAMLIWLLGRIIEPTMYLVVWSTVARAQGGTVGAYGVPDLAAYYIVFMVVNQLTFTWIMWEYEYLIKDGTLAGLLLRPLHPIHRDIADNLAYKVLTTGALLPVVALLVITFRPAFDFQWWSTLAFVPALVLAYLLRFLLEWTLALSAFWSTRTSALNQIYFTAMFFFAGRLAPLDLFPAWMQTLANALPFRWMVYFPVELLIGRLDVSAALRGLTMQAIWLAVVIVFLNVVWRAGVRQFSAVGS
jgi:ABC-2 type transport system permease protein